MRIPRLVVTALALASLACSTLGTLPGLVTPTPTAPPLPPTPSLSDLQLEVLDVVDQTVRDFYVREDLDGVAWDGAIADAQARVETGIDQADFDALMENLAATLPEGNAGYISRAELVEQEATATATYQGIGVYFGLRAAPEPRVVVLGVIPGSPAEAAGLQAHDAILAVDGEPVPADAVSSDMTGRIRGPAGTDVVLSLRSPGQVPRDVTVTRGEITGAGRLITDVLPGEVFYARLPVAVDGGTFGALSSALSEASAGRTLTGIILDLRIASSGTAWPLIEILQLLTSGNVGEFYNRVAVTPLEIEAREVAGSQSLPLILLVGPDTRGNPEVLAQMLQANGRATVIGLPTEGLVEQVDSLELPDGSLFSLATASFRDADGVDISLTGLTPDRVVEQDWDGYSDQADPVLNLAIETLTQ
jgi:carboxyl-terminal processing protease